MPPSASPCRRGRVADRAMQPRTGIPNTTSILSILGECPCVATVLLNFSCSTCEYYVYEKLRYIEK
jgi:hypothetical protein